jgi:hypothetical protein
VAGDGIGVEWDELQPELLARFILLERSDEQPRMGTTQYM